MHPALPPRGTGFAVPLDIVVIRISRLLETGNKVWRLEGWLTGDDLPELLRVASEVGPELVLDVSELRKTDRDGIKALHRLSRRGVKLTRVPPMIALQLANMAPDGPETGESQTK